MKDTFICYSRNDKPFAGWLVSTLLDRGLSNWVDWNDIPLSADWWQEIRTGIENADNFLFIISPHSINSATCNDEVEYAVELGKRIIPLVHIPLAEESDFAKMHPAISAQNWLDFQEDTDHEQALTQLMKSIETDMEYVRLQTHYLNRAQEWESRGRHRDFLLHGIPLQEAQYWLWKSQAKDLNPTQLIQEFLHSSQEIHMNWNKKFSRIIRNLPRQLGVANDRKIFISYRRSDSQHITDRIYDKLLTQFRAEDVFMDIFSIDLGVSFADVIKRTLAECAVVLVVIGDTWVHVKDTKTEKFRLMNEEDFVRQEVEISLRHPEIRVIPLLVSGASMPTYLQLPPSMRDLVRMNGTSIRPGRDFHKDMEVILKQTRKARRSPPTLISSPISEESGKTET